MVRPSNHSNLPTVVLALLCLASAACGGTTTPDSDLCNGITASTGEFEATVSGSAEAVECGSAVAAETDVDAEWGVQLLSTRNITQINIWTDDGGRPAAGSYPIVDFVDSDGEPGSGNFVVMAIFDEATVGKTLTSVTGTLTIVSSTADEVSGSFVFTARDGTGSAPADYSVTGTFVAANEDA